MLRRMAKRRGEQKLAVKKKRPAREAQISPARWFNVIITALLIGVLAIAVWGLVKNWLR
jgi:hypothetical protein